MSLLFIRVTLWDCYQILQKDEFATPAAISDSIPHYLRRRIPFYFAS
jgi:hypothetical protein